ncbi:DUF485 domain-containing protein [Streptomyces sp. NPDC051320]|uniref:DUF485 domain-containing protein n=1 Tax=Streptomyces sp. NPDC051320 TaxID=3154644 RepID=UPI00344A15D4
MPPQPQPSPAGSDLRGLRATSRRLRRRTAGTLLAGHMMFTTICCIAAQAMGTELLGHVSAGLLLATLQLMIILWSLRYYGRTATEYKDPEAERVRRHLAATGQGEGR